MLKNGNFTDKAPLSLPYETIPSPISSDHLYSTILNGFIFFQSSLFNVCMYSIYNK